MSIIIETSLGDLEIDLYTDQCPNATRNFLKLAKAKYYNDLRFYEVHKNFLAKTGDPSHSGKGGWSIYGLLDVFSSLEKKPEYFSDIDYSLQVNAERRYFEDETTKEIRHNKKGLLATSNKGPHMNESGFYITLSDEPAPYLDGKHTIFGEVVDGDNVLEAINDALLMDKDGQTVDDKGEPYQAIRIKHILIIDDPFDNPEGLRTPSQSPEPKRNLDNDEEAKFVDDNVDLKQLLSMTEGGTEEEIEKFTQRKIAKSRAHVLEILGDLPEAEIEPPKNVLFVCQLNPVTQESDLESIFWRFGEIKSCNVVRDWKTGDSLQYAFIEFEKEEEWINAYLKMNNVNIDERRIKVDFSQSVAKSWATFKKKQFQEAAKELFKEYQLKKDIEQAKDGNQQSHDHHRSRRDDRHRDRDRRRDSRERRHHRSDRHKHHRRDDSRERKSKKHRRKRSYSDERRHSKHKRSRY